MGKFNEQPVAAGKLLTSDGLHPSSSGLRVCHATAPSAPRVIAGPFAESKAFVAGYWLWKVDPVQDAIDWAKHCPMGDGAAVESRPLFEAEDFGAEFNTELREQKARIQATIDEPT